MQWSIVDDGCIIDLMDLGHRNNTNNDINAEFLRSTEDGGVYIFDSMNLDHNNNMQNNGNRTLRSFQDGVFIFDSMQNNNNSGQNLERFKIEEKREESCCICLGEFSIGSRAIRMPQHILISFINIASQNGSTSVIHVLYVAGTSNYTIFQSIIFVLRVFNVHYQSLCQL